MKKQIIATVLLLGTILFSYAQSITVTAPRAQDVWRFGETHNITWIRSGVMAGSVSIYLMYKNGQSIAKFITNSTSNDGNFSWTVDVVDVKQYRIKVFILPNSVNPAYVSGMSPVFFIKRQKPDLYVSWVKLTPAIIYPFRLSRLCGEIRNRSAPGAETTPASRARLMVNGPDMVKKEFTVPALAPGEGHRFNICYTVKKAGPYQNVVFVDCNKGIDEKREGNNTKSVVYSVKKLPDLVVCFKKYNKVTYPARSYFPVRVRNIGGATSKVCLLQFWIEKKGVKRYKIPALPPGGQHTITRSQYWGTMGSSKFDLLIDSGNKVIELHENNNRMKGVIWRGGKYSYNSRTICSDQQE